MNDTGYILKVTENNGSHSFYIVSFKYEELLNRITECTFAFKVNEIVVKSRRVNSIQFIKYNTRKHTTAGFVSLFIDSDNKDDWNKVATKIYVTPSHHDYSISLIDER